jgi:hypothetical protein
MRLVRKLLMLCAMSASALALSAGSASAQLEVHSEPGGEGCGEVTLDVHAVSGGCHVEAESLGTVTLYAYVPSKVAISACDVYTEGFVGQDGSGYITEVDLFPPSSGSVPCTRVPCDEADETMVPWPAHIDELGPGEETVEATFCVRPVASVPGTPGSFCTVHVPLIDLGGHGWEVGNQSEYFCEVLQPVPVSIEGDFSTFNQGERAEVIH